MGGAVARCAYCFAQRAYLLWAFYLCIRAKAL